MAAALLVLATLLEAGGDAVVRLGLRAEAAPARGALLAGGGLLLFGYGLILNLAPLDWSRLMGAYVAVFFVVAQVINFVLFRTSPGLPVVLGGLLILAGGAVAALWPERR